MSGGAEHEERAYVYMVRCAGGQLYTGWTNDPGARLHAHKTGKGAKATRAMLRKPCLPPTSHHPLSPAA